MRSLSIAVVISCYNLGRTLCEALDSVDAQTRRPAEVVVVDDGSTDLFTRQVLASERAAGRVVISTTNKGVSAARNLGVRATLAPLLVMLDADDVLESTYLEKAAHRLEAEPHLDFVSCGMRCHGSLEQEWYPDAPSVVSSLTGRVVHASSMFRRCVWDAVGGFDEGLRAHEEVEFWTAVTSRGFVGAVIQEPLLNYRVRRDSLYAHAVAAGAHEALMDRVYARHQAALIPLTTDLLLHKERFILEQRVHHESLSADRQRLLDELAGLNAELGRVRQELEELGADPIDFGDLRRVDPISPLWGIDRGLPLDRHFIHQFLDRHRADITGCVLEVKDAGYTRLFGADVARADVVDIDAANPAATIVANLAQADGIPSEIYDCFILTQTLGLIYETGAALAHAARVLKPGGVLLCTVPAAGRLSPEGPGIEGDFWRFTEASVRQLFAAQFPLENFTVEGFGNALTGSGFLFGLAAHEVPAESLDVRDPYFPMVYCVRAVKPAGRTNGAPALPRRRPVTRAVLMYHRFSECNDRRPLTLPTSEFARHLRSLTDAGFAIAALQDVVHGTGDAAARDTVAITIDDGYADGLQLALPILRHAGFPATYFVVSGALTPGFEFWWDVLDRVIRNQRGPLQMDLPDRRVVLATASEADRHKTAAVLKDVLYTATADQRRALIDSVAAIDHEGIRDRQPVMSARDVQDLAQHPGIAIGSHTVNHLWLPSQDASTVHDELRRSRTELEALIGRPVNALAYPYGGHSAAVAALARDAGYEIAVTTEPYVLGAEGDLRRIPRIDATGLPGEALVEIVTRRAQQVPA